MLFNSITYILFLTIFGSLAVWGPSWVRRTIFLLGSLAFYGFWRWDFLVLMIGSASVDYLAGLGIVATQSARVKKL